MSIPIEDLLKGMEELSHQQKMIVLAINASQEGLSGAEIASILWTKTYRDEIFTVLNAFKKSKFKATDDGILIHFPITEGAQFISSLMALIEICIDEEG